MLAGVPLAQRRPRCTPGLLLFFSFALASCFGFLGKKRLQLEDRNKEAKEQKFTI